MADLGRVKRIGIFGGTFDPVHLGHVATVIALLEAHHLDHVYIIPTNVNPHKHALQPLVGAIHRLQMVRKAFKNIPRCSVLPFEIKKKEPSYTIDTVKELFKSDIFCSDDAHFLLMGQDQLEQLHSWKNVHELFSLVSPLIARRKGEYSEGQWKKDPLLKKSIEKGLTDTPLMDISATDIRFRIKQGLFCGHLLGEATLKYIQKHRLYDK